jgi:putative FmdB family regulatory protein
MPIYEYECHGCGKRFERIVNRSTELSCPSCSSTNLEKLLSTFAVGSTGPRTSSPTSGGACGTCGDPRGPGSCSLN